MSNLMQNYGFLTKICVLQEFGEKKQKRKKKPQTTVKKSNFVTSVEECRDIIPKLQNQMTSVATSASSQVFICNIMLKNVTTST